MNKQALFLGCTVSGRALNYEMSSRKVAEKCGIELVDIADFGCCGYPVANADHDTYVTMAARNLALAEKEGCDVVALCSACLGSLAKVRKSLNEDTEEKDKVNKILADQGLEFKGTARVRHFMHVIYEDVGPERLKELFTVDVSSLKVAPHYGCHYMKPHEIFEGLDDPVAPHTLDDLISATGAEAVDYAYKLRCCGGGVLAVDENAPINLVHHKLKDVKAVGADIIALVCPFCAVMYDEYQSTVEDKKEEEFGIPVLYLPQLLGLAMGFDWKKDLLINKNAVKAKKLLQEKGLLDQGGDQ